MAGWQPIETAPKDGRTLLLGYFNSHGKWRTLRGQWFSADAIAEHWENPDNCEEGWYETSVECEDVPNCWKTEPTHWQPSPAAPNGTSVVTSVAETLERAGETPEDARRMAEESVARNAGVQTKGHTAKKVEAERTAKHVAGVQESRPLSDVECWEQGKTDSIDRAMEAERQERNAGMATPPKLSDEQMREIARRVVGDDPTSQVTAIRVVQETLHALAHGVTVDAATDEAAFQRGKRRGYTDGYYAAEVAARPVLQDALDMLRTERYGNTDPDKRERTIERIERFINGAPGVRASAEPTDDDMKRLAGKIAGTAAVIQKVRGCSEREAVQRAIEAMEPPPDAGVNVGPAPDITDEELGRRFTRCAYPGPNPMYRCNGCGHEEYGVRNLLLEHAAACGVTTGHGGQSNG